MSASLRTAAAPREAPESARERSESSRRNQRRASFESSSTIRSGAARKSRPRDAGGVSRTMRSKAPSSRLLVERLDAHVLEDARERVDEPRVEPVLADPLQRRRGARRARGGSRTSPSGRSGGRGAMPPAAARKPAPSTGAALFRSALGKAERLGEAARGVDRQDERPAAPARGREPGGGGERRLSDSPGAGQGEEGSVGQPGREIEPAGRREREPRDLPLPVPVGTRRLDGERPASAPRNSLRRWTETSRRTPRVAFRRAVLPERSRSPESGGSAARSPGSVSGLPLRPIRLTTTSAVERPGVPLRRLRELLGLARRELGRLGHDDEGRGGGIGEEPVDVGADLPERAGRRRPEERPRERQERAGVAGRGRVEDDEVVPGLCLRRPSFGGTARGSFRGGGGRGGRASRA